MAPGGCVLLKPLSPKTRKSMLAIQNMGWRANNEMKLTYRQRNDRRITHIIPET